MAVKIVASCINCWACQPLCPSAAIGEAKPHFLVDASRCTECVGDYPDPQCVSICPIEGAIVDSRGEPCNPPGSLQGVLPAQSDHSGLCFAPNPIPMLSANARRQQHYAYLMEQAKGLANDDPLARLVASYYSGFGTMPEALGLATLEFKRLLDRHFPGFRLPIAAPRPVPFWDPRLVEEKEELIKLMNGYRAGADESELWMSVIVATGCLANDHLWQDLGLWSRNDLSALMTLNFPGLATKNGRDMKWKKFLYKQLCIQEDITLCRAPSCEVCSDYLNCFGPEA